MSGPLAPPAAACAAVLLLALAAVVGSASSAAARDAVPAAPNGPFPEYALSIHVEGEGHSLSGVLKVTLPPDDPRAALEELWFHLPPNRFLAPDPRGERRLAGSIPFASDFTERVEPDPLLPEGFSEGGIDIVSVTDAAGRPLAHALADNLQIPQGYSVRDGLLRVSWDPAQGRAVVIRFRTRLPRRYWEGWSRAGVLVEHWYPVLARYEAQGEGWVRDVFAPRGGRYRLGLWVDRPWQLVVGRGRRARVDPQHPFGMPLQTHPQRSLPLVLQRDREGLARHAYDVSLFSYHAPGSGRVARLAMQVGLAFLDFARERYGLPPPATRIAIVQVATPPGDIRTAGNIVLVPEVYYRNNPVLDRLFVAQLSRALAQIWFGETVWADADRQAWMHLGLSGFLALDFFTELYGWDAGLHDIADWLKPRYREHFFEAPVRAMIRNGDDVPLLISLRGHPDRRSARIALHNKAPLVIRALSHVVGEDTFARALNAFFHAHQYRAVTAADLRETVERLSGQSLGWFFEAFFAGTPRLDFAIEDVREEPAPFGTRVYVQVRRTPELPAPVEVVAYTASGERAAIRWEVPVARDELVFSLPEPPRRVVMDPQEFWPEVERKNNHSENLVRVRPLFDWAKQREVLLTLQGRLGGNAIDGNYVGLGVRFTLDEDNHLLLVPIYGERTGLVNYEATWLHRHFLAPRLSARLTLEKLGGTTLRALGFDYDFLQAEDATVRTGLELRYEQVDAVTFERNGVIEEQPFSQANNVALRQHLELVFRRDYRTRLTALAVHSQPSYNSAYDFTTYRLDWGHDLFLGPDHQVGLTLIRGISAGDPPFQMRHFLGGPELLRGYPRVGELANDEIAAARLDYGFVFSRAVLGGTLQSRRFILRLFGDVGRGWDNDEGLRSRPQRQDVGFGLQADVNLLSVAEFPIRIDVAFPINDDEFREPQVILFGALNF